MTNETSGTPNLSSDAAPGSSADPRTSGGAENLVRAGTEPTVGAGGVSQNQGAPNGIIEDRTKGRFTPSEVEKMARWSVEDGSLTAEQANAALAAQGYATIDFKNEDLSSLAKELDAGFPAAAPKDYQFNIREHGEPLTDEGYKNELNYREMLSAARFPKEIGSALIEEIAKTQRAFDKMNPVERMLWQRSEKHLLENTLGPKYAERIAKARDLVLELDEKFPGLADTFENTGAGSSHFVLSQLVLHAERLHARFDAQEAHKKSKQGR